MFKVLFITFFGIGLGYLIRSSAWLKYLPKGITYTIWLLLFFFGLQVGANDLVVNNLDTLGLKALVISVSGCLGSCVVAWAVWRWIFRGVLNAVTFADAKSPDGKLPDPDRKLPDTDGKLPDMDGKLPDPDGKLPVTGESAGRLPDAGKVAEWKYDKNEAMWQEEIAREQTGDGKPSGSKLKGMLDGVTVVAFFAVGCICGWQEFVPQLPFYGEVAMYVLYALMVQVGVSIGSDRKLKEIILGLNPKLLLLPLGTIMGTLVFVAIASFFISNISLPCSLAIGAGFGYYSLSSVLITQIKEATVGVDMAAQLGTMALMANIMREVITLLFAPVIYRVFGELAPISTGGVTSMDSTLPVITAVCGKKLVFISIFHGVLVDFSVPFLVTFFASM